MNFRRPVSHATVLAGCLCVSVANAQGIATDKLIDSITVTGERERAALDVPNPVASKTADDLRKENLVNPEDALRYVPNVTIRKRYIGDRNALIGGRSFSTLQAARGLVLADGYLLSNFLGRFDAPRWNMISPEEIERVDVLYGPFSALYPGNSIGTTVAIRTRRPKSFEVGLRTTAFGERFEEYGIDETFGGHQFSAYLGNRFANGLWLSLAANRQESTSHPMQYYTVSADATGRFPSVAGDTVPVSGVRFDTDPRGRTRAVFGASAGAIDETTQDQVKLRAGYTFDRDVEIEGFYAHWRNDSASENRTFMRDEAGRKVWSGRVLANGIAFDVPSTAFAPNERQERHSHWGATVRTTRATAWNASLVFSKYRIDEDSALEASVPDPLAVQGTPGTNVERDGTGWETLELQAVSAPMESAWSFGAHTLSAGVHRNAYRLVNPVYTTTDWRRRAGTVTQLVEGKTELEALYLQDEWALSTAWSLTLGARYEEWSAFDGVQWSGSNQIDYPSRQDSHFSPKASLAFTGSDAWSVRLSAGRGVRFPTVAELFQGTATASSIIVNDANLKAEISDALDLTIEHSGHWGRARVSLFEDDVRDSIFAQTNVTVTPNITNVQNVGRVRTRGIETAFTLDAFPAHALRLDGSIAYARSKILENENFPISVGNAWPRVPRWRGTLQIILQPNERWFASLGVRHSGRTYNRLENDDFIGDIYGGVSRFTTFDARVAYAFDNALEIAFGIDNLTDERSYQVHPLPMRTGYVEARWSFKGDRR